jgi:hypothetical protein
MVLQRLCIMAMDTQNSGANSVSSHFSPCRSQQAIERTVLHQKKTHCHVPKLLQWQPMYTPDFLLQLVIAMLPAMAKLARNPPTEAAHEKTHKDTDNFLVTVENP